MTGAITNYLKYANLQMAAESLFGVTESDPPGAVKLAGSMDVESLTRGNDRASRFTSVQAEQFLAEGWTVVEHKSNTSTGFSGTLFKNAQTGELVLSFRSTEFADDAARDNQATNVMEIKAEGWAFGQIADMQAWVESLYLNDKITPSDPLTVTGYSLGGHLATAFNLLYPSAVAATYTFNGAGVGEVLNGKNLTQIVNDFRSHRASGSNADLFTDADVLARYGSLQEMFKEGTDVTLLEVDAALQGLDLLVLGKQGAAKVQAVQLYDAMQRVRSVVYEAERVNAGISSGGAGDIALNVGTSAIAASALDYQLAVLRAGKDTAGYRTDPISGGWDAYAGRNVLPGSAIANFYDLYGAMPPSAVANSQLHYGAETPIFIEDQPLYRGSVIADVGNATWKAGETKLLVNNFGLNDFGDTHSLVLIVDSLSVQNALAQLDPTLTIAGVSRLLTSASNLKATSQASTQGKADGDTLESLINALADTLGLGWTGEARLEGDPDGNSWARIEDADGYSGRDTFHMQLKQLTESGAYQSLVGKVLLTEVTSSSSVVSQAKARGAFADIVALETLSPFVLKPNGASGEAALNGLWQGSVWGTRYAAWLQDKALIALGKQAETYTDEWITDRAEMLRWQLARNTGDTDQVRLPGVTESVLYRDIATASSFYFAGTNSGAPPLQNVRYVTFGGSNDDQLGGTERNDRLYGGAGDDVVIGGAGEDYLQGDAGEDTLDGGSGNDTLIGGSGSDTYKFSGTWAADTILDTDGVIEVVGRGNLTGGGTKRTSSTTWQSEDGHVTYSIVLVNDSRRDLVVSVKGGGNEGSITIQNWSEGKLGISLGGEVELPPTTTHFNGDFKKAVDAENAKYFIGADGNYVQDGEEEGAADLITGTSGKDRISGLLGDDALLGREGDDYIEGGEGSDVLMGGMGADTLIGGSGNDAIYGSSSGTLFYPEALSYTPPGPTMPYIFGQGFSWIEQAPGVDEDGFWVRYLSNSVQRDVESDDQGNFIDAGSGLDWVLAGTGSDVVHGGDDADDIYGLAGRDKLYGDAGADRIFGDGSAVSEQLNRTDATLHGADFIVGGGGNDILIGQGGDDTLYGGDDDDKVYGDDRNTNDTPIAVHGNDYLDGGAGVDQLWGGGEDDTLFGGTENDKLWGDDETDIKLAGAAHGDDWLDGEAGDDELVGGGKDDLLFGGAGNDNLWGDAKTPDALAIEFQGNDFLDGQEGNDDLYGGGGNDQLYGGSGADVLQGGTGRDLISGGAGADTIKLDGGAIGDDSILFDRGDGHDLIQAGLEGVGTPASTIHLGPGLTLSSLKVYRPGGSTLSDAYLVLDFGDGDQIEIQSGAAAGLEGITFANGTSLSMEALLNMTVASGTNGDDIVNGTGYADVLDGGDGADQLQGFSGDDQLTGGGGRDVLIGGKGNNTYVFAPGSGSDLLRPTETEQAILRFDGVEVSSLRTSLIGNDLVIQAGSGDLVRIEGYVTAAIGTTWNVEAGGQSLSLQALVAAAAPVELSQSLADRKQRFVDDQLVQLQTMPQFYQYQEWGSPLGGAGVPAAVRQVSQQLVADETYSHSSYLSLTPYTYTIGTTTTNPIYAESGPVQSTSGKIITWGNLPTLAQYYSPTGGYYELPASYVPVYGINGNGQQTQLGWYVANEAPVAAPSSRLIGWQTTYSEQTITVSAGTATQLHIKGTAGADEVRPEPGTWTLDTLFRGVIETGAGNDRILLATGNTDAESADLDRTKDWGSVLPGVAIDYMAASFRPRGLGAWIDAGEGDDEVVGTDANDVIIGGAGSDVLDGQAGADTYLISSSGNDIDRIRDVAMFDWGDYNDWRGFLFQMYGGDLNNPNRDIVEFDTDIQLEDLSYRWNMEQASTGYKTLELFHEGRFFLAIDYSTAPPPPGREVSLAGIERFHFSGGQVFTVDGLLGAMPVEIDNSPPVVADQISDQDATEGDAWTFVVPEEAFQDADPSDTLELTAALANGDPLPSWLSFDAETRTFSGTPAAGDVGGLGLRITATDSAGASVSQDFELTVAALSVSETITGTIGDDELFTTASAKTLLGLSGDDTLHGGEGDDALNGGAGSDDLFGANGSDTLDGGANDDNLNGGAGNDTYLLARGGGQDSVWDFDVESANVDVAMFGGDVTPEQLWFRQTATDLEVSIVGTEDKLIIQDWYVDGSANHIEQFKTTDGKVLLDSQVQNLIQAMASFAPPPAGQTTLPPDYQSSLATVIAANWQ